MEDLSIPASTWSRSERLVLKSLAAALFALLTVLSSIRILLPFTPVPMTLQTFVVPLAGGFLGAAWGAGSMLLYLGLGFLGFNAFAAASGGLGFFVAPTAGYLLSYPLVAVILGWARNRSQSMLILSLIGSNFLVFFCGMIGLLANTSMTIPEAFQKGVAPFFPGELIKLSASYLVLLSYRHFRKSL